VRVMSAASDEKELSAALHTVRDRTKAKAKGKTKAPALTEEELADPMRITKVAKSATEEGEAEDSRKSLFVVLHGELRQFPDIMVAHIVSYCAFAAIQTFAGSKDGYGDGLRTDALFSRPQGFCFSPANGGSIIIAE
jgi:hypothetical protein